MRTLLLLLALLLTLGAVWWITSEPQSAPPPRPASNPEDGPSAVMVRESRDAPRPPGPATRSVVDSAAGSKVDAGEDPTLTVHVLGPDGRPAAGAEVAWCVMDPAWHGALDETDRLTFARDPMALLRERGDSLGVTDGSGRVDLPSARPRDERAASSPCQVHALWSTPAGTWHGVATRPWRQLLARPLELRLVADRSLRFQVVGPQGLGVAGVPLVLPPPWMRALGSTDEDGILEAAHVQSWYVDWDPEDRPRGPRFVEVALPGLTSCGVEVDPARAPPGALYTIHLPATGSIEVVASWLKHRPNARSGSGFTLVDVTESRGESAERRGRVRSWQRSLDVDTGRKLLPIVALGKRWKIPVGFAIHEEIEFTGPRTPGEKTVVTLAAPPGPRITGRLLHDGAPVAEATVSLGGRSTAGGDELRGIARGRSAEDGSFVLRGAPRVLGVAWRSPEILGTVGRGTEDPRLYRGRLDVELTLGPEPTDLGDVAVDRYEPLWEGHLVEAGSDNPVANQAFVEVCEPTPQGPVRSKDHAALLSPGKRLTVYGPSTPTGLVLCVMAKGYVPSPPVPLVPGTRGGRIELHEGGAARLVLRTRDARVPFGTRARLIPDDGRDRSSLWIGPPFSGPGPPGLGNDFDRGQPERPTWLEGEVGEALALLLWTGLPPGRYRLEIGSHGTGTLLERRGIEVLDGAETDLGVTDLEGQLTFTELKLQFPAGFEARTRPPDLRSYGLGHLYFGDESSRSPERTQIDSASAWFVSPGPQDLVLEIPGCRRRVLHAVSGEVNVSLEPGIPVRIASGGPVSTRDDLRIRLEAGPSVEMFLGGATYSPAAGGSLGSLTQRPTTCLALREGDAWIARVTAPGLWRLRVAVRDQEGAWKDLGTLSQDLLVPVDGTEVQLTLPDSR